MMFNIGGRVKDSGLYMDLLVDWIKTNDEMRIFVASHRCAFLGPTRVNRNQVKRNIEHI
jgi:hypothetical protein